MSEREGEFQRLSARPAGVAAGAARSHVERYAAASAVDLRPRGVGASLDAGLWALRERFVPLLLATALLWLPMRAALFAVSGWERAFVAPDGTPDPSMMLVWAALTMVFAGLVYSIALPYVVAVVHGELVGRPIDGGPAFARALRALPGTIVLSIVAGLIALAGCFALGVGIIVGQWLVSCAIPAYAVERRGIGDAIKRTFALSTGKDWAASFGRWVGITAVAWCITSPLSQAAGYFDDPTNREQLESMLGMPTAWMALVYVPLTTLLIALSTAGMAAASAAFYVDRCVRRDGLDLRLELERLRAAAQPS